MKAIHDLLLGLEAERQRALVQEDHARLHTLFDDDLLYVHTTGLVQDKGWARYRRHRWRAIDSICWCAAALTA